MAEQQPQHHKKAEVATNRPSYREGRRERAVKVYTINQESKYLLVQNVHALGVTQELLQQFALYGNIEEYRLLDEYPSEPFTDVYWIKFVSFDAARIAKKKMDNRSFFGKNLHVCYAPEYETVQDTREKLQQRREMVARKTARYSSAGVKAKQHGRSEHREAAASSLPGPSPASPSQPLPGSTPSSSHAPAGHTPSTGVKTSPFAAGHVQSRETSGGSGGGGGGSHDSHMTQFPVLPTPPVPWYSAPFLQPGHPSSGQDTSKLGRPSTSGQAQHHRQQQAKEGRPDSGMGMGHAWKGTGSGNDWPSGLSQEERVALYLASEGSSGLQDSSGRKGSGQAIAIGGKRTAAGSSGGEGTAMATGEKRIAAGSSGGEEGTAQTKSKPKKRRRI